MVGSAAYDDLGELIFTFVDGTTEWCDASAPSEVHSDLCKASLAAFSYLSVETLP